MKVTKATQEKLAAWSLKSFIVGGIAAALCVLGFITTKKAFAPAYLTAYLFWIGLTVGCFPMIMLHHLTLGNWGYPIRRFLEITLKLLPLMALLFLPILFCIHELYEWSHLEALAHDELLRHKAAYLNVPYFIIRVILYFVVWFGLAHFLNKWSSYYDELGEKSYADKLQKIGALGLILYGLTVTFSSMDWGMSLEPHWFSTIYGLIFVVGDGLASLAFAIIAAVLLSKQEPLKSVFNTKRSHDLGSLLFAFVMVWAYVSISQFIIIWSANLQEETPWYLARFQGKWYVLSLGIVIFHFFVPFFLLLMRRTKRNFQTLASVAALVLMMRYLDLFWFVKPAFFKQLHLHWLDIVTFIAIGGLWLGMLFKFFGKENLTFDRDPILQEQKAS